jgi:hypothetical protein
MKKIILIAILIIAAFSSCKKDEQEPEPKYGTFKAYSRIEMLSIELESLTGGENYIFNNRESSDLITHQYMYVANKVLVDTYAFSITKSNGFHSYVKDISILENETFTWKIQP